MAKKPAPPPTREELLERLLVMRQDMHELELVLKALKKTEPHELLSAQVAASLNGLALEASAAAFQVLFGLTLLEDKEAYREELLAREAERKNMNEEA